MNMDVDSIADTIRGGERFRITVSQQPPGDWAHRWTATIYDLEDHGTTIPYAVLSGDDLLNVMTQAAHYVFVAGVDSSERFLPTNPYDPRGATGVCPNDGAPCSCERLGTSCAPVAS